MLFFNRRNLSSVIVELLASRATWTADDLMLSVGRGYKRVSLQAVYKELRRLQREGVVVKAGRLYSLALSWVHRVTSFSSQLERNFKQPGRGVFEPPGAGKRTRWRFSDLRRVDDFWGQAMLALVESERVKRIYQYTPHAWYHLTQVTHDTTFESALRDLQCRAVVVICGATKLDRALTKFWSPDVSTWYLGARSPHYTNRSYLTVIGPYVLEVKLDSETTHLIERIFRLAEQRKEHLEKDILALLTLKASVTVTLRHDQARADLVTRQIIRAVESSAAPE